MSLGAKAYNLVHRADHLLSGLQVGMGERSGTLLTIFLHLIFENEREMESGAVNPQERMTAEKFRNLINCLLESGYTAVSIEDVARGLNPGRRNFLLTFDDGYFNNHRALPILQEFNATAVIFLSANHVREGRPYWWDVLYRIRRGQGRTTEQIGAECARLNTQKTEDIERQVRAAAPEVPFTTVSDLDRPMNPAEVKELASTGRFYFENHTANHAVLSAYSPEKVSGEISEAQDSIAQMTGRKPVAIAYPNGLFTPMVTECARQAGLKLGFSTVRRKEYVGGLRDPNRLLTLGRFQPVGNQPIEQQVRYFRSDLMLTQRLREMKRGL